MWAARYFSARYWAARFWGVPPPPPSNVWERTRKRMRRQAIFQTKEDGEDKASLKVRLGPRPEPEPDPVYAHVRLREEGEDRAAIELKSLEINVRFKARETYGPDRARIPIHVPTSIVVAVREAGKDRARARVSAGIELKMVLKDEGEDKAKFKVKTELAEPTAAEQRMMSLLMERMKEDESFMRRFKDGD